MLKIHFSKLSNIIKKNTCRLFLNVERDKTYFFRKKLWDVNYAWNDPYIYKDKTDEELQKMTQLISRGDQNYLLPQIQAAFPTNQWAQLKRDLREAPGWGLKAAMKG